MKGIYSPKMLELSDVHHVKNSMTKKARSQFVMFTFLRPRLHERFFACDGDAIFLKVAASPGRGENRMCSHPRTGDATDEKIAEKKSREIQ